MEGEKLLRDVGLTKYEASAYATLLKEGVIGAQELSKISNIPVGKIYETLTSLNNYGFVEIQKSRPRKYMPIKPKIALDNLQSKKIKDTQNEMEIFKQKISEIENKFEDSNFQQNAELKFCTTAIGEEDLIKTLKSFFGEAENEFLNVHSEPKDKLPHTDKVIPLVIDELISMAKRGIKIKFIMPEVVLLNEIRKRYASIEDEELKQKIAKYIEIRILEDQYKFSIVDDHIITFPISNPLNPIEMIGIVKIYDEDYAKKLKDKFKELWIKSEKTTLE